MSTTVSPFKFQTARILEKGQNDGDMHPRDHPIVDPNVHLDKIVKSGTAVVGDTPFTDKQSQSMKEAQSFSHLDKCTDTQAKEQTTILSKVKSAKDSIARLFKPNSHLSLATRSFFTPISQNTISRIRVITIFDPRPSGKTRWEAVTSLVSYSGHVVEEHVRDFASTLRSVGETPLTAPEPQRNARSAFLSSELHTIEEEVGSSEADGEEVHSEPKMLAMSHLCEPLPTRNSEAKYDAMLAAEFATFSFDSDDIKEWSDEVEKRKQAKMDAHFTYVSGALAVPVPKLSACFPADNPSDFTAFNEPIDNPSPVKSEASETNSSFADSSLMTSVDDEESRPQLPPTILRGLRRIRNYEDLKNIRVVSDRNDSFSDLSCWSPDLGLSDLSTAESKVGMLRRSVRCDDLRVC